jgi:NAD-dependent deacetylase
MTRGEAMLLHQQSDLIQVLKDATNVVILTGAGISAESGIPTFREAQTGLWEKYSPQDLATPQAFEKNPERVWQWYAWRRELIGRAEPNPAHYALAEMEKKYPDFVIITQNVDGLHQRAGSQNIIEIHGNIQRTKCSVENRLVDGWTSEENEVPVCPHCGALLRPDVVWFGESLPQEALENAFHRIAKTNLFLSIGTSGVVEPAASLPFLALQSGAKVIEINIEPTPLTPHAHFSLQGSAAQILPELVDCISD